MIGNSPVKSPSVAIIHSLFWNKIQGNARLIVETRHGLVSYPIHWDSFFLQSLQEYEQQLSLEKKKQGSLIGQLKDQLEEMERCVAMVWWNNIHKLKLAFSWSLAMWEEDVVEEL